MYKTFTEFGSKNLSMAYVRHLFVLNRNSLEHNVAPDMHKYLYLSQCQFSYFFSGMLILQSTQLQNPKRKSLKFSQIC